MDIWIAFQALLLGVVEGLTEFLPISSTGHLIVVGDLLGFNGEKATAFKIIIQLGAILAVMWEFRAKVIGVLVGLPSDPKARRFSLNLFLAFIPAVIFGLAFADLIEHWLFNPITVATAHAARLDAAASTLRTNETADRKPSRPVSAHTSPASPAVRRAAQSTPSWDQSHACPPQSLER